MHLLKKNSTNNSLTLEHLHRHFSFIIKNEHYLTDVEFLDKSLTFYLTKKNHGMRFFANITVTTSLSFSIPTWTFASDNEEFQIQYKKLEMTPLWFSQLYKEATERHLSILQHHIPRSSFSKKLWNNMMYKGNEHMYTHETSENTFSLDEWEHMRILVTNQENN